MSKVGTGPGRTTPTRVNRSTIGWNVAIAIGEEKGVYLSVMLRARRIRSAAGALEGNAKSRPARSTEVAICRDPAACTSTFNPCAANASATRGSWKNGIFSEPTTPRTTVSGAVAAAGAGVDSPPLSPNPIATTATTATAPPTSSTLRRESGSPPPPVAGTAASGSAPVPVLTNSAVATVSSGVSSSRRTTRSIRIGTNSRTGRSA